MELIIAIFTTAIDPTAALNVRLLALFLASVTTFTVLAYVILAARACVDYVTRPRRAFRRRR